MRHRVLMRSAAVAVLLGAGAVGAIPAGGQEAPAEEEPAQTTAVLLQYGWWNKAQQSPAGGNPTPAPPGAPSDGIFVAYEPAAGPLPTPVAGVPGLVPVAPAPAPKPVVLGPEAFGAVRYSVPAGAEASLTLRFTPTTTSQPGGVNPDGGTLSACPVSSPWDPVQNGRYDASPKYDCANGVVGVFAGDTVSFPLAAALATNGLFDLAIVPSGTKPFKLSIGAPDSSSLALTSVPETEPEFSSEEFDASMFEDPAAEFFEESFTTDEAFGAEDFGAVGAEEFGSGEFTSGGFVTSPGSVATTRTPAAPVGSQVAVPAGIARNPFRPDASRGERMMALAVLMALAGALWWVGGKPVRPPRLLGSLGAGIPVVVEEIRTGGIGRFARVRPAGRPPRLY